MLKKIRILSPERLFIALTFTYSLLCVLFFVLMKEGAEVVFLSANYSENWNSFYAVVTRVAEINGIFIAAVVILFVNRKLFLPSVLAVLLETFVVHGLKWLIAEERPRAWAQLNQIPFPVQASDLLHHSFPSGHTAVIFCIAYCLVRLFNNRQWTIFFFVVALLVSFSRIYLMAHFVIDTGAGALIGTFSGVAVFHVYEKLKY